MRFPTLSSPVDLGPLRLRNRVALLPHGLLVAEQSSLMPTRRHVDYYAARAGGGAALICTETAVVSPDSMNLAPVVLCSDPEALAGYRAIVDAVHAEGALISGQMSHCGNQAASGLSRLPLVGPSRLPDTSLREAALPMDRAAMDRILEDFVSGAKVFRDAGFDSIELKIGHDGLLRQFLSPLTNNRVDEYGGSVQNRMRYIFEVAAAVRDTIGDERGLSARLCIDERFPGGYGLDDGILFGQALASSGLFSHITTTIGNWGSMDQIIPPMTSPEGFAEDAIRRFSSAVDLPVIGHGVIRTPEYAERVLAEGHVAAIGMARELMAEPDWAQKALAGVPEQIRPCTACNQLCIGNSEKSWPTECTVNPSMTHGERRPQVPSDGERIVVIGGGPAGMEAARTAAEDGFEVELFELQSTLGGRLRLAAETGRRSGWARYLAWQERELRRLGVTVRVDAELSANDIGSLDPALVVFACGASPAPPPAHASSAISIDEFLTAPPTRARVAMVDMGAAGLPLWTTALEASIRGAEEVIVITPGPGGALDVDACTFADLYRDMIRGGVRFLADHTVDRFDSAGLIARNVYTDVLCELDVDTLVASTPCQVNGELLASGVNCLGIPVKVVGDALVPRDVSAAIREGQSAARVLVAADGLQQSVSRSL